MARPAAAMLQQALMRVIIFAGIESSLTFRVVQAFEPRIHGKQRE